MDATSPLFVRLQGQVRGPVTRMQLREWAETRVVSSETEVAEAAAGPWVRLEALPMAAESFPQRPQFGFKAAAFECANDKSAPPVDHRELIAAANRTAPPPAGAAPAGAKPSDVVAILQEVAQKQKAHEAPMEMKRRSNRRRRDYLIVMIPVNAVLIALLVTSGHGNPVLFVYLIAALSLFNGSLAWVMFQVMDRY